MAITIDTKAAMTSKTLWGGVFLLVLFILQMLLGIEVNEADGQSIIGAATTGDWSMLAAAIVSFGMVVIGRMKAKKTISLMGGSKVVPLLLLALPCLWLAGCVNPQHDALAISAQAHVLVVDVEYLEYVEADPELAPEDKQVRRDYVATFKRAVDTALAGSSP